MILLDNIEIIERPDSGNSTDGNNSSQSESPKQANNPTKSQSDGRNAALLANRQRLGLGRNVTKTPTEIFLARPYCDQFESQA